MDRRDLLRYKAEFILYISLIVCSCQYALRGFIILFWISLYELNELKDQIQHVHKGWGVQDCRTERLFVVK